MEAPTQCVEDPESALLLVCREGVPRQGNRGGVRAATSLGDTAGARRELGLANGSLGDPKWRYWGQLRSRYREMKVYPWPWGSAWRYGPLRGAPGTSPWVSPSEPREDRRLAITRNASSDDGCLPSSTNRKYGRREHSGLASAGQETCEMCMGRSGVVRAVRGDVLFPWSDAPPPPAPDRWCPRLDQKT